MVCQDSSSETAPSPELLKTASPSSAESSFRELDDAFLQTQTRIWLGEVLKIRLNEQLIISELLADGELLFLVSKVVWKLLLAKHMELKHIKASKSQPFASKSNSGRYRPYSNVDSFLKICKILELTGVDLFSPSDVVERRNTRKVCMCIRSFSKKLRSKDIDVPDFDIVNVTCAVTMPKDVVGYIRKSIELSHRRPADSSTYYLQKNSGQESREVYYSVTDSIKDWETYSDQSNDTEIRHLVHHFDDLCDYESEIQCNSTSSMVENDFMSTSLDELGSRSRQRPRISDDEFQLLCSRELLQYHISETPYSGNVHVDFSGGIPHLDTRGQESRMMEFGYTQNELLRDNDSILGTPMNNRMSVIRDVSSNAKDSWDQDLLIEENIPADVHKSASSHGSCATPLSIENGRCFGAGENMEVLHEVLNLGDQFEAENDYQKSDQWEGIKEYESQEKMKYKEIEHEITYGKYTYFVKELEETEHSLYSPDCFLCNKTDSSNRAVSDSNDINATISEKFLVYEDWKSQVDSISSSLNSCSQCGKLLSCQSSSLPQFCKWDQKGKFPMTKSGAIDNNESSHEETMTHKQETAEAYAVGATDFKSLVDDEQPENDSEAIASNAMSLDNCEDGSEGVIDMITNDATVPANYDEDVSNTRICITNQSSELECNDGNQSSQDDMVLVCHTEHTLEPELPVQEVINPDNESAHSFDNLDEKEEKIAEISKSKPRKKLILKSVFGGATAVGLLFLFLHLRFVFDSFFRLSGGMTKTKMQIQNQVRHLMMKVKKRVRNIHHQKQRGLLKGFIQQRSLN
ncbi:uncharacterized protein LOC107630904 isoform X1 [Arachis ipaensis]|uniref:uncharacterized protein LOC107630904 isoform X1 n=2 Tax=Arachis ipaensis TaxID=130454 RepID=UPI0007AFC754|nr:uncharacterized protein LOC107630904 isoform X1 [Arachis ipaensis]XP_025637629.1 uncharacterized protein LOC112733003 isoform X1 [Arachis hypogaea]